MKIRNILLGILSAAFVIFEAVAFILIHIARVTVGYSLHYVCIIVAALYSVITLVILLSTARVCGDDVKGLLLSTRDGNMIRIAMLFTLTADYFLVAIDKPTIDDTIAGVAFFLGTQLFICLHILANDKSEKARIIQISLRAVISLILIVVTGLVLGRDTDALAIMSTVYYANLVVNAIFAHRSGKGGSMLTVGLVLFALCDINVGLHALNNMYGGGFPEGSLLYNLLHTGVDLMWLFYIPSQTLIPLTTVLCSKEEGQKKKAE